MVHKLNIEARPRYWLVNNIGRFKPFTDISVSLFMFADIQLLFYRMNRAEEMCIQVYILLLNKEDIICTSQNAKSLS